MLRSTIPLPRLAHRRRRRLRQSTRGSAMSASGTPRLAASGWPDPNGVSAPRVHDLLSCSRRTPCRPRPPQSTLRNAGRRRGTLRPSSMAARGRRGIPQPLGHVAVLIRGLRFVCQPSIAATRAARRCCCRATAKKSSAERLATARHSHRIATNDDGADPLVRRDGPIRAAIKFRRSLDCDRSDASHACDADGPHRVWVQTAS